MPERPDLRQIAGDIAEALEGFDREQLLDVLTYVFKEYVVEGPPPMLAGPSERLEDLEGLSFAQLIQTLQTRLDVPELALFQVEGERVSVRVGGVLQPLQAGGTPRGANIAEQVPPEPPAAEARRPEPPRAADPVQAEPDAATAPRPSRGVSVRGRPADDEAASAPAPAASAKSAAADPPAKSGEPPPDEPADPDDDDASIRFSLLELD